MSKVVKKYLVVCDVARELWAENEPEAMRIFTNDLPEDYKVQFVVVIPAPKER